MKDQTSQLINHLSFGIQNNVLNQNQRSFIKNLIRQNQHLKKQLAIKQRDIQILKQLNKKLKKQSIHHQKVLKHKWNDFYHIYYDFENELKQNNMIPNKWVKKSLYQKFQGYRILRKNYQDQLQKSKVVKDLLYTGILIEEIQKLEQFTKCIFTGMHQSVCIDVLTPLKIFKQQIPSSLELIIRVIFQQLTIYIKKILDKIVKNFGQNLQKLSNNQRQINSPSLQQNKLIYSHLQELNCLKITSKYKQYQKQQKLLELNIQNQIISSNFKSLQNQNDKQVSSQLKEQTMCQEQLLQHSIFNTNYLYKKQKLAEVSVGQSQIINSIELNFIDKYQLNEDYQKIKQTNISLLKDPKQINKKLKNQIDVIKNQVQKYGNESDQQSSTSSPLTKLDKKNQLNMNIQNSTNSDPFKKKQQGNIIQMFSSLIDYSSIIDDKQVLPEIYNTQLYYSQKKTSQLQNKNKQIEKKFIQINQKLYNKNVIKYFKEPIKKRHPTQQQIKRMAMGNSNQYMQIRMKIIQARNEIIIKNINKEYNQLQLNKKSINSFTKNKNSLNDTSKSTVITKKQKQKNKIILK